VKKTSSTEKIRNLCGKAWCQPYRWFGMGSRIVGWGMGKRDRWFGDGVFGGRPYRWFGMGDAIIGWDGAVSRSPQTQETRFFRAPLPRHRYLVQKPGFSPERALPKPKKPGFLDHLYLDTDILVKTRFLSPIAGWGWRDRDRGSSQPQARSRLSLEKMPYLR
jgi:hypothetical protein